jgi:hypothetical protein
MQNKLGGPRTEQGKARSSQNAMKHGLTSNKMYLLQNENPEAWAEMLGACIAAFKPATPFEHKLIEEIAFAKWRLRRLWTTETALFDIEMEQQSEAFASQFDVADEGVRQALAFKSLAENGRTLALLSRYESRLKRDYRNAIKTFEERREKAPNEPQPEPESEPCGADFSLQRPSGRQPIDKTASSLSTEDHSEVPADSTQEHPDRELYQ